MEKNADTRVIYIDESGNTELGMQDKRQPFITFASHNSLEDFCKATIETKFKSFQGNEIKYKNMGRKKRISYSIEVLKHLRSIDNNALFITYIIYKPLFYLTHCLH